MGYEILFFRKLRLMKTRYILFLVALFAVVNGLRAQVTTEPTPLQEDATGVVVYFHADQGNKGLAGQPASAQIYAHTGVITSASSSGSDWKYAPVWGDNSAKYKLEYVSPNLWRLNIGNLRQYYGVPAGEVIKRLMFVFRLADSSKEGKGAGGADIAVNVVDGGIASLPASVEAPYPGGQPTQGAVRGDDGSVTFCLAAPGKSSVFLIGSWNDYQPDASQVMSYTDFEGQRYFWTTVNGLAPDKPYPYYYVVDYNINVADPYARLVLDPWNDKYISPEVYPDLPAFPVGKVPETSLAVYQENINDFTWKHSAGFKRPANSDLLIYELLLRDFTGTVGEAKGNGTVRAAISRIPYLKRLGVNAVELLPINEFNGNNSWGYNPNFYFAPDKAYGTPSDYKEFIDACHEAGLTVILDVVFNQADWQHPWYQMYEIWENPFFNATAPHAYSVLNDWNQGHPLVQKQWKDMMRYWLEEYRIDGFRFDLVKGLADNDAYANNSDAATNAYNAGRVKRMRELQLAAQEVRPDVICINEDLAEAKEENEMAAYGQLNWSNWNNAGCQFAMGYESDSALSGMYAPKASRTWGSTVSYLESHDEQRLAYKQSMWGFGTVMTDKSIALRRLGSTAAQMIMAPGAHMIWQFSELGDAQNAKDQTGGNNMDPKIVVWNYLDDADRVALHDTYMELFRLRTDNPELFAESADFTSRCAASDWKDGRSLISRAGDKEIFTLINPNVTGGNISIKVDFTKKDDAAYEIISKSYGTSPVFNAAAGTVTVPANSYVVIGSKSIVSVDKIGEEGTSGELIAHSEYGLLTIEGAVGGIAVYGIDGIKIAETTAEKAEYTLPTGLYLIISGNGNKKIFVR